MADRAARYAGRYPGLVSFSAPRRAVSRALERRRRRPSSSISDHIVLFRRKSAAHNHPAVASGKAEGEGGGQQITCIMIRCHEGLSRPHW